MGDMAIDDPAKLRLLRSNGKGIHPRGAPIHALETLGCAPEAVIGICNFQRTEQCAPAPVADAVKGRVGGGRLAGIPAISLGECI